MRYLCWAVLVCTLSAPLWAADYVWLEGEAPAHANIEVSGSGWGNKQFLSQEQWLNVSIDAEQIEARCPAEGVLLSYAFEAATAGPYEVWDRIGFEFVRSPFDWRLDQGQWQTVTPDQLTTDLMEIAEWCEVAWIKMGDADLTAGPHTLEIRLARRTKEENGKQTFERILYASDALCLYQGTFRPNGKWKPGEEWQTDDDRQAAAQVFEVPVPAAADGERTEVPLDGPWQVCRYDEQEVLDRDLPTKTLPDAAQAYWMSIPVPGNKFDVRPELRFCHRFVYRTRVAVPAEMAGHGFFLLFPSLNMIASVFVNGMYCGGTRAMFAQWDCDLGGTIRAGETNEICIVIKDAYYAFSPRKSGESCRKSFNVPVTWMGDRNYVNQHFDFPVGSAACAQKAGLLETPSLVATGLVYTTDVFVQPSVQRKELGLQISLRNPAKAVRTVQVLNEAVPVAGGASETVTPQEVTLDAGEERTVTIAEPWADPQLWWPDEPNLYDLVTTLRVDGRTADALRTRFGFREWEWTGTQFRINGVPWQFWADCTLSDGGRDPDAAIRTWREHGQNMWRFWGTQFGGLNKQQALDLMDERGIVVRRSGIFDGQGANYLNGLADNKELFDHWIEQLKAQVREERNHPSVLIWSLENEITFINSRNLGMSAVVEPEIGRAAREVMAFDPTRPVMVDGGNCLTDNSLPVNGVHYMESFWRDYPDEAYTLAKAYRAHEEAVLPTWGKNQWQLVPDRPIFMGECFYARGSTPSAFAQFGGEGCFGGWGEFTRVGVGRLAKMLAEGYRWHGVAAYHFWMGSGETDLHYNSWKPVCVLCREWDWTFNGGSTVGRTLKAFNNTHLADPIEVAWTLQLEGAQPVRGTRTCALPPGGTEEFPVALTMPNVTARTNGEFTLTCSRNGQEVFREVKPVAVLAADGGPKPAAAQAALVVLDPGGSVKARLAARNIGFTAVETMADIPATARVVVVGKDALSARDATDPRWVSLAAAGARVLVLDQTHPLRCLAVPADLAPTDNVGSIAFVENLSHPVFSGLDQPDLFTWSGDHVVYRNAYRKATRGAVSLVQCDEQLGCSALAECQVNEGLLLLCQMVVGEKLGTDAVAQRLFDNMLAYCDSYRLQQRSTVVVMDPGSPESRLLAESGLQYDRTDDIVAAVSDGKHDIVVFGATPTRLQALAGAPDKVKAFTDRGGWLMAWGVTPEGLADFDRIVGVEHLIRPFELERVTLPAVRDPLLSGLTVRDVTMESSEQIFPWAGDKYLVDDEFTYIVDLDDIAPFAEFPGAKAGDRAAARAAVASWPRNLVNGFTSADAWKLIYYMSTANPKVSFTLPRPEELDRISLVLNVNYAIATQVKLYFDDDPTPVTLTTQPNGERQDFDLEPRQAQRITIELAAFDKAGETTGIDNLWLHVRRPEEWTRRVVPLLNIGGLVKYPMGQGGLVLNQLNIKDSEAVPDNAQKKRTIATTLLRNLHAVFAGAKVLSTANLDFQPLPLHEQCNQHLVKERGWFEGGRDLSLLPHGDVVLEGVPYAIRDFKTSPAPSCVMLAGPGAAGPLPTEVKGLRVGARTDVLYFLHTFNQVAEWRPGNEGEPPPVLFTYTVNYADGQTAQVPVVYGEGVGPWIARQPAGLPSASVAWAAPFADNPAGDQAVVYQMQWTNPRPDVEIASVDLAYGPQGAQYGTPALIAMTAARHMQ